MNAPLVANARMYSVNATVSGLWRRLFEWIAERSLVRLDVIEHRAPLPLDALWRRDDLGSAFICGYPWVTWSESKVARPVPVAAPVPLGDAEMAQSAYHTDIVVRSDSSLVAPADLKGTRFAFTTPSSQSGYQAPRRWFADFAKFAEPKYFAATIGPLVTPRRVVDAVLAGDADAGPLDSYWHSLLRHHEPATAARLRVIGRTASTPMPLLVCSANIDAAIRRRLTDAFVAAGASTEVREIMAGLRLAGFQEVRADIYDGLVASSREADALGYRVLR